MAVVTKMPPLHAPISTDPVSKANFPDGVKTSGQHPPLYALLEDYDAFPKEIQGPTVWKTEDYQTHPEKWVHRFTPDQIGELSEMADAFIVSGASLASITTRTFPLPAMGEFLREVRVDLLDGKGFILFKGFPVEEWGSRKCAVAYMGIGVHLGYLVSQNGRGHILGHVKDLGEDPTQTDKVRIYRTNARQFFHADPSDIVGLLCIACALEGGESDIISSHHVYNILQKKHPEVLETLTKPIWYFDRKGETSEGEDPYIRAPIYYIEPDNRRRVFSKYDPYFVKSLARYSDKGIIPPLSPEQTRACDVLEQVCLENSLHMILEIGDIQFLSNEHIFHARTAYTDYPPPQPRRHLMRLWVATPEGEGGWTLPFKDSKETKRGGIQVNNTPPVAPLDGE